MTFAELLQKVRDYTEVDSSVLSDSILDSMIRDAELRIFREVDADYAREYATANLQANSPYLELSNATSTSGSTTTRRSLIVRSFLVFDSNQSPTTKEYLDKRDTSFIFEYNSTSSIGAEKSILSGNNGGSTYFGQSVAIYNNFAVVGAPYESTSSGTGAAYMYYYNSATSTWNQSIKLVPKYGNFSDSFGYSVAINNNFTVIASFVNNTRKGLGGIYIYKHINTNQTWTEMEKFIVYRDLSDPLDFQFTQHSAAINNNFIIYGGH